MTSINSERLAQLVAKHLKPREGHNYERARSHFGTYELEGNWEKRQAMLLRFNTRHMFSDEFYEKGNFISGNGFWKKDKTLLQEQGLCEHDVSDLIDMAHEAYHRSRMSWNEYKNFKPGRLIGKDGTSCNCATSKAHVNRLLCD